MSASQSSAERGEPNLVPILDMVFQLITFFMLVINFKASEVDKDLDLPILGSAQPTEDSVGELLVLNLRANGDLYVRGQLQQNPAGFFRAEANIASSIHGLKLGEPLPVIVVVRADRALKVKQMMNVVDTCRASGFDKFDFIIVRSAKPTSGA